jgi:hypothetical protein
MSSERCQEFPFKGRAPRRAIPARRIDAPGYGDMKALTLRHFVQDGPFVTDESGFVNR